MTAAKAKKKKSSKSKIPQVSKESTPFEWLYQVAFWGTALLLFFPPYFRGLFFATEQEKALIFAVLIFWVVFVWRWLQRDYKFLADPLDYFALGLPVVYVLAGFFAVNKGLAVEEIVNNILYFLTFWSVSRLVTSEKNAESIIKIIYISTIGVALAGLATSTGIIHIKDGFQGGRIFSTYQYPNALASLLGGVVFMGAYLWNRARDLHKEALESTKKTIPFKLYRLNFFSFLYTCGNFLLLAVLFGTKSRGGLLVFAFVFLIYLVGAGAEKRLINALHLGYLGILAFIGINKFIPLAQSGDAWPAWFWILGTLLLAMAGQLIYQLWDYRVMSNWLENKKKLNITFATLAGVIILAAGVWLGSNPGVIDKATSFNTLKTGFHRIYYMGTAGEMILECPVLGWGGGGWQEAYKAFIDYRYPTKEVHSYYFQLGVETGFLGLLVMVGILGSFLYRAHRLYHGSAENTSRKQLIWALTAAFLMIAGHALIDFDLSLSALSIVLWSIFGIVAGLGLGSPVKDAEKARKKHVPLKFIPVVAVSVVSIMILAGAICLVQSHVSMRKGIALLRSKHVNEGIHYMEKAAGYNPFKADYHITLAQVYKGMGKKEQALEEVKRAVDLSRYNVSPRHKLIEIAVPNGEYALAAQAAERTLELAPNELYVYETYGKVFDKLGVEELKQGNKDQSKKYFTEAVNVPAVIKQYKENLSERDKKMWKGTSLEESRKVKLSSGKAFYWLGEYKIAGEKLQQASKSKKLKAEALMYLSLLQEKQGRDKNAEKILKQAIKVTPKIEQHYKELKDLPVL
ncbi:MAG: O-antigen ligase family protein [Clostridiales bacterium]|nr:O-antigen ligase family protein [Clostridiales bacterium]MCF8023730.1 O-antigen ligase family protein [Clostridiales bacterium]